MRSARLLLAAALGIAPMVAAGQAAAAPPVPDLTGYTETPVDPYVTNGEVYFQTPAGLLCAIRPAQGRAGCDGPLPGVAAGANEIVLASDQPARGLRSTANPQFVKPTGAAAPVLAAGRKIVFEDFECAVGDGPSTVCTKGAPVVAWMVVDPQGSGVGPPTAGLPDGFPDPNDFVVADEELRARFGTQEHVPGVHRGGRAHLQDGDVQRGRNRLRRKTSRHRERRRRGLRPVAGAGRDAAGR